jgi:P-type Mg2+ transporter
MEPILVGNLIEQVNDLSEDGFRVLAVANKKVGAKAAYSKADEENLVLTGYLAFLDPPKDTAANRHRRAAPARRHRQGPDRRQRPGHAQGLHRGRHQRRKNPARPRRGKMSDEQLAAAVETRTFRAALARAQKARRQALQKKGHVVGFMGDGINDAPALRAADVGISVDNAVDIAKESADMILLEKSLMVLEEGVLEGRKVFVNILKYIRMGASSNFGNMFSVLGASAWFPFLPMQPHPGADQQPALRFFAGADSHRQRRRAADRQAAPVEHGGNRQVHPVHRPRSARFSITPLTRDVVFFKCNQAEPGAAAGIDRAFCPFDAADHTYAAALFNTGWFVESIMTQTLIIHVIRTNLIPVHPIAGQLAA